MDAIVAVYSDWGIGRDGTQPLVLRADRKHFRAVTGSGAVIVGRRTLADFPGGRPLPGRQNIVVTRRSIEIPGASVVHSPAEAAALGESLGQCFVIGGAGIYREMLPWCRRVFVTKIDAAPVSDAFFPDLDADPGWRCTDPGEPLSEDGVGYRFAIYERI